jgi:hypothetical protein
MTKFERRNIAKKPAADFTEAPSTDLPVDYLRLVEKTLTDALQPGLTELKKLHPTCEFSARGTIYSDEVLLVITLSHGVNTLAATTLYASADFNPTVEKPGLEATLSACLDAAGTTFEHYLDPNESDRLEQLAHHSLSALEEAPFDWTPIQPESPEDAVALKVPVYLKMDKSNIALDSLTEKWLLENDPSYKETMAGTEGMNEEQAEDFLNDRLEAIKKAGSSGGGSGPITH